MNAIILITMCLASQNGNFRRDIPVIRPGVFFSTLWTLRYMESGIAKRYQKYTDMKRTGLWILRMTLN